MPSSASKNRDTSQVRTYVRAESIVFLKTKEAFGGLSNMAGGFPLKVNGIRIFSAEGLYQACRFPHMQDVQRVVLAEASPMTAKMKVRPYRSSSRPDWDQVRVRIMRWCLRVKLVQHWKAFGDLLLATGDKPIVEESRKDDFWGANPVDERTLVGMNVLGRLLMELREELKGERRDALLKVEPLPIPDFLLMGQPIPVIEALAQDNKRLEPGVSGSPESVVQSSLFEQPALLDGEATAAPMHEVNEFMPPAYENSHSAITNLKPYPEYKDSGLPWLEKAPGHWRLTPNRALMHRRKVLVGERHTNYKLLSLTKLGVIIRDISTGKGKFSSDMGTSQEVRKGDLVFCLFDVPETPRTVGLSSHDGMITGAYTVFECSAPLLARFLDCYYRAMDDRKLLSPLYSGLRNTIPPTRFLGTKTAIPPTDEQAAIVRFLDHATRRLDKAIRDKRKIIALLNEQKQAIIHRAVTRGLNPDVPLKDSGIPWLGQIPAHWNLRRLRFCIEGKLTYGANAAAEFDNPDWPRYLRITDFSSDGTLRPDTFRSLPPSVASGYLVQNGDILFARSGATVGKTFLVNTNIGEACFAGYLIRARPNRTIVLPDFLFAFTQSSAFGRWKDATFSISTIQNIGADKYANLLVPLPSIIEQSNILDYVLTAQLPVITTIKRIEREIELLREYRTRLIADVVTGKLDVREAAKHLPEMEEAAAEPDATEPEESAEELTEEDA